MQSTKLLVHNECNYRMSTETRVYDETTPGHNVPDELASSDLSYLSDIEEEVNTESFSAASSSAGSSVLNSSQLATPSIQSDLNSNLTDTGFFSLDWRAELTPGTVCTTILSVNLIDNTLFSIFESTF